MTVRLREWPNLLRETRVRRGVRFLNRHQPGWRDRVDTERLDSYSTDACPGAQACGDWDALLRLIRGDNELDMISPDIDEVLIWLGFEAPLETSSETRDYAGLTTAWLRVLDDNNDDTTSEEGRTND